uniref:Glycosyltransferase family 92 protein n=1 Tax=Strongyloides venezuelensis TaxID=75913 RepID=A0A0K0F3Q2_STRVS
MLCTLNKLFYLTLIFLFPIIYCNEVKKYDGNHLFQLENSGKLYLWKFYVIPKNYALAKKGTILGIYLRHCYNSIKKDHFYISSENESFFEQNDEFHTALCDLTNYKCLYYPHQSYFKIPFNKVIHLKEIEITSNITGETKNYQLDATAANSKPFDGITVCTPLLYYYNNWLQMFMFLEKWREEKNVRVIIYYRSISSDVYELLKYYQKLNIVHLIPAPIFPRSDPMEKFTATAIGMGPLFFNDCMYRNNTKYLTVMDVDEYFHIFDEKSRTRGLLEFVKKSIRRYPHYGFFNFESLYISYLNKNVSKSFHFATKGLLTEDNHNKGGKSIMLTDKINYPSYHLPLFTKVNDGHRYKRKEAIILHARPNIIFKKVKSKKKVQSLDESERKKLVSNYKTLTKRLNKNLIFTYKPTIIKNLKECMLKKTKKDTNSCYYNVEPCKEEMNLLENWIYTSKEKEKYQDYVKFE